ncbi:MAG: hypothetical protein GDA67_03955 [Nitrospira sp. CR1.3]|nr:hypothetical protein [Nitrospira sp. CR1.3]
MTARDRLELISVKVDRAKEHLATISADLRAYLDSKPYAVGAKRAPDTRRLIYSVAGVRPTPLRISAVLGDAIHNLRSALDHLAYQLVWVGSGKKPSSHVYFPIADDRARYIEQRRQQLKGATPTAIATLDALMPYKGGNDALWRLHKLNNVDKHRVLLTAGSAFRSVNIGAHMSREMQKHLASPPMADKFSGMPAVDLFLRPADRLFPLKTGDELLIDGPDAEMNDKLEFRFEVAFGEQDIAFGDPIVETLTSMVQLVEDILPKFEPHLQ